jgi:imidazole glycerol-phosphate synthase subunit HisF
MYRKRIIPVLLLKYCDLVKSVQFKKYRYIGDPINAVRLFNQMQVDELILLDIAASQNKSVISLDLVKQIGEEANMPIGVGGGITTIKQIKDLFNCGADKVILGTSAALTPGFITQASNEFGSAAISVCIDVKQNIFSGYTVSYKNAKHNLAIKPLDYALQAQSLGAGELIIQCVNRDGMMCGYDYELLQKIADAVTIPVVALGGAGNSQDINKALQQCRCHGAAAGSCFVYYGANKGVLLNYINKKERI